MNDRHNFEDKNMLRHLSHIHTSIIFRFLIFLLPAFPIQQMFEIRRMG